MELKTIKLFCHKNNLGEGLEYVNGLFKVNIDNELNTIATALTDLNKNKVNKTDIATVYKVKGTTTVSGINSINVEIGDVYNLADSGTITLGIGGNIEVEAGDNVVYTENGWDKLSAAVKVTLEAGDNISIEGNKISAKGYAYNEEKQSFATGSETTTASGWASHAEGCNTKANGYCSHTEGFYTEAKNYYEHAEGNWNVSNTGTAEDTRKTIHSIGIGTSDADCKNAHEVMNNGDTFIVGIGDYDGTNPYEAKTLQKIISDLENIEPLMYTAGTNIDIVDNIISAKGYVYDKVKGSFAEGKNATAEGEYSHAEGVDTKTEGDNSHAEGWCTIASGKASHAEGYYTIASGFASHAEGIGNISNENTIHSVGIGGVVSGSTGDIVFRKNAHEITIDGDHYIIGVGGYDGTNPTEALTLQELLNIKEYSLDFKEDLTTIQEINISNTWKLNQIVGYNVSSINLSIEGQETQVLTLTGNNWVSDSLTTILIYPTNRIMWEIIKADETLPAVLGISKIKQ